MKNLTALARIYFLVCFLFISQWLHAQVNANFSTDRPAGCAPLTVKFTNTTGGATASTNYLWDFGNGNTSTLKDPGAIFTEEKTYNVTLTVTDGNSTTKRTTTVTVYKKPTANFSSLTPKICIPDAAGFTSTSIAGDGFINNYYWDMGDGTVIQGNNNSISHYYQYEQKASVSLTVTNSFGCTNSTVKEGIIEVMGRITPHFTTDKYLLCNLEEVVQFTNNSTGPGTLSYNWDFADGRTSTEKNPKHNFEKKGVHPVKLTVTNTDGCRAISSPLNINAAYFNTDFSTRLLCREASFTGSSFIQPSNSLWQFGDGNSRNTYNATQYIYPSAGEFNVKLINTYSNCKDTITKVIKVEDGVNYNSTIEAPSLLCKGNSYTFSTKSSETASNYSWEFGDGSTGNWWRNVSHVYNNPGTYTLKVTNTFGTCKETVSKEITVHDLPDPKGFIVDYGGVCGSPVTIKFNDTTKGAVRWEWRLDWSGNNPFSTQKTTQYTFNHDGTIRVILTVFNAAGCSQTVEKWVNVYRPSVSIFLSNSSSLRGNYDCDSLTVTFTTYSNQPIKEYVWNLGDGNTSTSTSPTHSYKTVGVYVITLNYTLESGCKGTTSYSVRVYGKPKADFDFSIPCGNTLSLSFNDRSYFSDQWNWGFPGQNIFQGGSSTYNQFADTGKYNITFISHIGKCSDTIVKQVNLNILPSGIQILKAVNTCEGNRGTIVFDQSSLRIKSGTWNFGDGISIPFDSSNHTVKHTYTRSGTYNVTLTGQGTNCILTSTTQVIILLKQSPILTSNKTTTCSNETVAVALNNLENNPHYSTWRSGYYINKIEYNTGEVFTGNSFNNNWTNNTSYSASLQNFKPGTTSFRIITTSYGAGCADTSNYVSLAVNGPIAGFKIVKNEQCFKSAFDFIDTSKSQTSVGLKSWHWNFGDGNTKTTTGGNVQHTYLNPGNYNVQLTVYDNTNCSSNSSAYVNARGAKANFIASGLFVPDVPLNTTVNFYNHTNSNSYSLMYKWNYGDGNSSTNYSGLHTYTQPGTNTVELIVNDASINCADTARKVINVKNFNSAFNFTTTYLSSGSCPPVLVRFNNISSGTIKVKWDFGDGTSSEQFNPAHTYHTAGLYKIKLSTYGYNGLTGTYWDSISISQLQTTLKGSPLQGCISEKITLTANGSANNFVWDFGDGMVKSGSDTSNSHQFLSPGIYQPTVILKDNKGCQLSSVLPQKIVIDSLHIAIKGIPAQICDSSIIYFKPDVKSIAADMAQQPLRYQWNFGTGNEGDTSNLKDAVFNYSKPGIYTVRFNVSSPFGCIKEVSETVVVHKKAVGSISGPTEICEGSQATFKGAGSVTPTEWKWNFGNGSTAQVANPSAQVFTTPGNYNIQLILKKDGCLDSSVAVLTVHPKPVVQLTANKQKICLGEQVVLSAAGGTHYQWSPSIVDHLNNSSTTATPEQTTHFYTEVLNEWGCSRKDSILVTVVQPFKLSLVSESFICAGSSANLSPTGAVTYQWINNTTGLSSTQTGNTKATPASTTTYTVVGKDSDQCFTDTASIQVVVHPLPTIVAEPDFEILAAESKTLQATASADVVQWSWSPQTFLSCTQCPSPVATPKTPIDYIVTVKNAQGCTASDTIKVKLSCSEEYIFIPTAFTPDYDGKNDVFYIKGKGIGVIKSLQIFNRWGEVIFTRKNFNIDDRSAGWDGRYKGITVPNGTYLYLAEMQCDDGKPIIKKGNVTVVY